MPGINYHDDTCYQNISIISCLASINNNNNNQPIVYTGTCIYIFHLIYYNTFIFFVVDIVLLSKRLCFFFSFNIDCSIYFNDENKQII
jgi:hypothetical protein